MYNDCMKDEKTPPLGRDGACFLNALERKHLPYLPIFDCVIDNF